MDSLARHVTQRAMERFGEALSEEDLRSMEQEVSSSRLPLLSRQGETKEVHAVIVGDTPARAVYCTERQRILTLLPVDYQLPSCDGHRDDERKRVRKRGGAWKRHRR